MNFYKKKKKNKNKKNALLACNDDALISPPYILFLPKINYNMISTNISYYI